MANEMKKSTKQTMTVLAGTIILGKYTLVRRLELAIKLFALSLKAVEKNVQGKVAAATNNTRGIPSGILDSKSQPINVITERVNNGRITLQRTPIAVCL